MITITFNGKSYQFDSNVTVNLNEDLATSKKRISISYSGTDSDIINTIVGMKDDAVAAGIPIDVSIDDGNGYTDTIIATSAMYMIGISTNITRTITFSE